MEIKHLPTTGSDHAPMLVNMEERMTSHNKSSRFHNFLTNKNWFEEMILPFLERDDTSFSLLRHIPKFVTEKENNALHSDPDMEEVEKAIFDLNGISAGGPDGLTGKFYQSCWEIIS
ncbi:hypothetical protein KY284_023640 [Solanum tuberosum]|nr:hypothetical protein KY284_023640 [Solanum tuberosum]